MKPSSNDWELRPCRGPRPAGGFTLLEVIVAFTILAVAMVALMQAFSFGMRGLTAAESTTAAVLHARSKLDEIGSAIPLEEGEQSGDFADGFEWTVGIRELEQSAGGEALGQRVAAYRVEVAVSGPDGRKVTLQTLRLAPVQ